MSIARRCETLLNIVKFSGRCSLFRGFSRAGLQGALDVIPSWKWVVFRKAKRSECVLVWWAVLESSGGSDLRPSPSCASTWKIPIESLGRTSKYTMIRVQEIAKVEIHGFACCLAESDFNAKMSDVGSSCRDIARGLYGICRMSRKDSCNRRSREGSFLISLQSCQCTSFAPDLATAGGS